MDGFDGTVTAGRKGLAYDWRSVLLAAELEAARPAETSWVTDEALAAIAAPAASR